MPNTSRKFIRIAHINIRSLVPKMGEIKAYIYNNNIDVLAVTETWLNPEVKGDAVGIDGFSFFVKIGRRVAGEWASMCTIKLAPVLLAHPPQ